jgi:hypothetical protein
MAQTHVQTSRGPRCPRCTGQLFIEPDLLSDDLVCLQCGFRRGIPRIMAA